MRGNYIAIPILLSIEPPKPFPSFTRKKPPNLIALFYLLYIIVIFFLNMGFVVRKKGYVFCWEKDGKSEKNKGQKKRRRGADLFLGDFPENKNLGLT